MDIATLPSTDALTPLSRESTPHWQPGLAPALHNEVFAPAGEASGAGAVLALALDGLAAVEADCAEERSILWVQTVEAIRLNGRPYRSGLPASVRRRVLHVVAKKAEDALFALEEGMHCHELACVIGEIAGNPKVLDFTASRRLSLTAEKHGVPLYLVRLDAYRDLSSARMRWEVAAAPSPPPRWNAAAPGQPAWCAELFRARSHRPGEWIFCDDGTRLVAERSSAAPQPAPDPLDLARAAGARSLAAV